MDIATLEREVELLHSRVCYALADPKRVLILYLLSQGEMIVNDIAEALDTPQPTVSRHLRILRERNLVEGERDGTTITYKLSDARIIQALDLMREILVTQLKAGAELAESFEAS